MKAKNILMTLLLVIGAIAAKASGFPPELALVSQPVMVYNHSSITVYYDVENIGDYTYRGYVSLFLNPDYGYSYAEKYVKVRPGRIKRISLNIPLRLIDRRHTFTIMPYYELGDELYSFTTFEYFDPICFYWDGPRTEHWVVVTVPPRIRYYRRPGSYRYYYDGFRPPMPPVGHELRPMDPMHHTYGYHHNNGGYPANHINEGTTSPAPATNSNNAAPNATVRPNSNASSMSASSSSGNNTPPASSSVSSSSSNRPNATTRPSASSSSSSVSRPSSPGSSATTRPTSSGSSSSSSSSSVSRPSSTGSSATTRPTSSGSSSSSSSSSVSRPSSSGNSATTRPSSSGNSSSVSRPSTNSSSSARTGSSTRSSSSNVSRSSSTGSNATTRTSSSSSSTSSSRGSAGTGRR